jgi:hypothetical protein
VLGHPRADRRSARRTFAEIVTPANGPLHSHRCAQEVAIGGADMAATRFQRAVCRSGAIAVALP